MNDLITELTTGSLPVVNALTKGEASGAIIAGALGELLGEHRLKAAAMFSMVTAVLALRTPDAAGELTIRVPRRVGDVVEVEWTGAPM